MTLRFRAHNSATKSENRIHSDDVARQFGFRSGLVPGATVYGYMMQAVEEPPRSAQLRLLKPVFEEDVLVVSREADQVTATRENDELCAHLTISADEHVFEPIPEAPLPERAARLWASASTLVPGTVLGTFRKQLEDAQPETLLNLANLALIENFLLHPWLHVSSQIAYDAPATVGDEVTVYSRIHDRFDKKGREFIALDVVLMSGPKHLQSIRHTAIYRLV